MIENPYSKWNSLFPSKIPILFRLYRILRFAPFIAHIVSIQAEIWESFKGNERTEEERKDASKPINH